MNPIPFHSYHGYTGGMCVKVLINITRFTCDKHIAETGRISRRTAFGYNALAMCRF